MSEVINRNRRAFLANGVVTVAAAQFVTSSLAHARPAKAKLSDVPPTKPGTSNSFTSLKQIDAGLLNIGYAEAVQPTVQRSFFCTARRTTFTAMSMSPLCWHRQATG